MLPLAWLCTKRACFSISGYTGLPLWSTRFHWTLEKQEVVVSCGSGCCTLQCADTETTCGLEWAWKKQEWVSVVSAEKNASEVCSTSHKLLQLSGLCQAAVVKPAAWWSSVLFMQASMGCLFHAHKGSLFCRGHDAKSLQAWNIWMSSNFYSQKSCSSKCCWMYTQYKGVRGEAQQEMGSYKTSSLLDCHN